MHPASRFYPPVQSPKTAQDYTAYRLYAVSGCIAQVIRYFMVSLPGVTLDGFPPQPGGAKVTTDASGCYTARVEEGWGGRVTPAKTGFALDPFWRDYVDVRSHLTRQGYSAYAGYWIHGLVLDMTAKPPKGLPDVWMGGLGVKTGADGYYRKVVPVGWTGDVTPSLSGWIFWGGIPPGPSVHFVDVSKSQYDVLFKAYKLEPPEN
jgi:hypothetical protein